MLRGYFDLLATAICWSIAGVLIRFNGQSGIMITAVGSFVALIFNLLFFRKKLRFNKIIVCVAISQFLCFLTFVYANQLTTVGNAIVLQYTSMIFVLIYQSIDQKKLPQMKQIGIIVMVIFGMILFFFDKLSFAGMLGNVLAIISGAFFGFNFYMNTKKEADAYTSTVISYMINICLSFLIAKDFMTVKSIEWVVMIIGGIVQMGLANLFYIHGIRLVNAFSANIICMSEVLFSPLWAFLIFHETIGKMAFIGAIIIILGIVFNLYLEYDESKKKEMASPL